MTTETLIAGDQSQPAADAAAPASTASTTLLTDEVKQDAGTPADANAEAPKANAPADGDKPAEEAKPGAPETYEAFTLPEGIEINTEVNDALTTLAREHNLTQEQAQKFADLGAKLVQDQQAKAVEVLNQARTDWAEQSRGDKEIGGDKFMQNLATASKALNQFASPQLRTLLNETGLGNHPEVIRAFVKIGQAISSDQPVVGRAVTTTDVASKLYPTMTK